MDTIPEKGKRYKIKSRPYDMSFLDIIESDEGEWVYSPKKETDNNSMQSDIKKQCV